MLKKRVELNLSLKITLYLFIIILFLSSIGWNVYSHNKQHMEILKNVATASIAKDKIFRLWAVSHGGVYVPVDEKTLPNPYLKVNDRDIYVNGKHLTLMNPAYMMRQMMDDFSGDFKLKGRITSLKLINPNNKPDAWETQALKRFNEGEKDISEVLTVDGKDYFRQISPLIAEKSCLECHGHQGYKEGDIRGGISVRLPVKDFVSYGNFNDKVEILSHLILLVLSLLFAYFIIRRIEADNSALLIQQDLLFKQSKLAQMGEMISMIAHQWRQPLAAISSISTGLKLKAQRGKIDQEIITSQCENIISYSEHLSSTIDDFRNFFKPNKEAKDITYSELLRGVLSLVEVSIKNKSINLIQELNCEDRFSTYVNEIKQVILNLIKNAEDILIEKEINNPYIKIVTYKKDSQYILEVRDNGGGVADEIIDKIFDPYFSTKSKKDGTGLGLYMSKTIVEDHCHGKLSVRNGQDGAVFTITLGKKID